MGVERPYAFDSDKPPLIPWETLSTEPGLEATIDDQSVDDGLQSEVAYDMETLSTEPGLEATIDDQAADDGLQPEVAYDVATEEWSLDDTPPDSTGRDEED